MIRRLVVTPEAQASLDRLAESPADAARLKQIKKVLGYMETDLRHPSLKTHEFTSLKGPKGEKVFEAYAQNQTPGAYRVFFFYGPDAQAGGKRVAVLTVLAIAPHS